jgi:riboflavin biosynthesis pyrimidine reductase
MYETMLFWDFAGIWQAAEKIVYSRGLQTVSGARIEREFDRDAVGRLKQSSGADIAVGGAELAGRASGAGLVDECHLFFCPIVVGGGDGACQTTSARNSNFSMSASSETASFTSITA